MTADIRLLFQIITLVVVCLAFCESLSIVVLSIAGLVSDPKNSNFVSPNNLQVRIVTIGNESVVQNTVSSLPEYLDDRHVITEQPIAISGANVHIVPESFECKAVKKGRALEWARRNIPNNNDYVLYLDEDSVVQDFGSFPAADVIQLLEIPRKTKSSIAFFSEIYRVGNLSARRAISKLPIPLHVWGGGLIIRTDLQEEVTWNRETFVEDVAFVWAASRSRDLDYEFVDYVCRNESPPSISQLISQRRRWVSGGLNTKSILSLPYQIILWIRNVAWGISPLTGILVVLFISPFDLFGKVSSGALGFVIFVQALVFLSGIIRYNNREIGVVSKLIGLFCLPLIMIVNGFGAALGLIHSPSQFNVTRKVGHSEGETAD